MAARCLGALQAGWSRGPPLIAGQQPELDPIVRSTNIPVAVYQPALGPHRCLSELMTALWTGDSLAFSYIVPSVRDWFFMHESDTDPAEITAANAVPANLQRLFLLLDGLPKPLEPAELTDQKPPSAPVRGLIPMDLKCLRLCSILRIQRIKGYVWRITGAE